MGCIVGQFAGIPRVPHLINQQGLNVDSEEHGNRLSPKLAMRQAYK
jgi:hypothetical protein